MEDTEFRIGCLGNGLKIVCDCKNQPVEYCGLAIRAGARDEREGEEGIAHFVEHTIFKGTTKRRSSHIINRMERVGGELNAYTTKEETYVYAVAPAGNIERATELIADLVINSRFPDQELDKEREVVAEEIDSYLDTPSEAVYDDFEDMIFAGTSLGHNILGTTKTIATFSSESCINFVNRLYLPSNMVFFYSGPVEFDKVVRTVEKHFSAMGVGVVDHSTTDTYNNIASFDVRRNDGDNHQAHNIIGARTLSLFSPDRFALALINNILGGPGMNSRLNIALRERRGLVYTVESSTALYSDTGLLTIYFGCNPDDTSRCKKLVYREMDNIASKKMTESALNQAKRQYLGQMTVASASAEQRIMAIARSTLFRGEPLPSHEVRDQINRLTPDDILRVAALITPARCSSLTLG